MIFDIYYIKSIMAKNKGAILKKVFEEIAADDRCELTVDELLKFATNGGLKLPKGKSKTNDGPKRKLSGWNVYLKFYRSSCDSIGDCGASWKDLNEAHKEQFDKLAVVMTEDRDNGIQKTLEEYDNPLLVRSFESVDTNGDGVVSKEEYEKSLGEVKKAELKLKKTKKKTTEELKKKTEELKNQQMLEKNKEEELKELKKNELKKNELELERQIAEKEAQNSIEKEQEILDHDSEEENSDESDEED